ncbi:uncharacterized protein LOC114723654 [Neltuma alba]|uniref:uncharacterized protein LOC114723654 n=1 Tax=Neltuma alba TaxID=207710 RepID=UPI0010A4426C|nr:uncharacterized protein LOC114723654 [Prosopis alba]XP_028765700.1 uncharacterized protein LOC114723654 [Prosopis alba]XP_028765701.1 uncharacterized protein LOC114723654 [Prosopis alba]XP_028765702.1 uncharacterized protein LOC114723654 [Prosopis alba]XP_028765703.1 uncharacterized protein LOC114723654 [Prosopis alba]
MALDGRVNPDCSYAANPYHECTETCLRKIREAPPQNNKKSSGVIPLKFGWKKKLDSKPQPPVIDRTPASKVRASYPSEKKKAETKSNERISSEPVSTKKHIQDVMPIYQKDQAKDGVEQFGNNHTQTNQEDERKALDKVVPCAYADDTGERLSASAGRLLDFSFSGVSLTNGDEDSEGETESVASEPRLPVGGYRVRESYAPILRSILNKYEDIGESVQLESAVMRTYYMECVCFVVRELQTTSITEFTKSKVKELMAILKDVESAQIQVAWLRSILNEVAEYIELINRHQATEMAKAHSDSEIESLREELESESKTLAQKEQEVAAIKNRIAETRDRLRELELRSCELDKSMSMIKSKVDSLDGRSLIEDLL